MGNCLQPSKISSKVHDEVAQHQLEVSNDHVKQQQESKSSRGINVNGETEEGTKVKIVLTKGELEWLMIELKVKNKKLEEALAEIQRSRAALKSINIAGNSTWQPSLESISEDDLDESER